MQVCWIISVLFRKYQESRLLCDDDDHKIISHSIPISGVRIKVIRAGKFQGFFVQGRIQGGD